MAMIKKSEQYELQLGAKILEELIAEPQEVVEARMTAKTQMDIFKTVNKVLTEDPRFGFIHSALCAMSLPLRRPPEENLPIVRRDGKLSLVIRPLERSKMVDGELVHYMKGVPFGPLARLVMSFIMTEAVKTQSREIYLGKTFTEWMRRMGIKNTKSGGPRGTRALIQEQVERLLSCEWTIRWDEAVNLKAPGQKNSNRKSELTEKALSAFEVNDMRLIDSYGGLSSGDGEFVSKFVLSEPFYQNLIRHAVPMNERALVALRSSATQMDLYTWLSFRLPKISRGQEVLIQWEDLRKHLANNSKTLRRFRSTVRDAWDTVSGVYQQARHSVDLSDEHYIRLRYAEAPVDNHLVKRGSGHLEIISARSAEPELSLLEAPAVKEALSPPPVVYPDSGNIYYETELAYIARTYGSNNSLAIIGSNFRKLLGDEINKVTGDRLIKRFTKYCQSLKPPA